MHSIEVMGQPRGRLLTPQPNPAFSLLHRHPWHPTFNRPAAKSVDGLPPLSGGPPVDNTAIDEGDRYSGTVGRYSIVLGILLSYICFSSIKITVMVFIVGGCSAMLGMAWFGGRQAKSMRFF